MSKLKFNVRDVDTSRLILNLANSGALAANLPQGVSVDDVAEAHREIAAEIDRRLPRDVWRGPF